jgi:hypothetical protein
MKVTTIRRWESRGRRYWLELFKDEYGYSYRGDNSGGSMGAVTEVQAIAQALQEVSYWPSKAYRVI